MHRLTNENGYTLIESLVHLVIVTLLLTMMVMFFEWYGTVDRQLKNANELHWQQFAVDFQREISDVSMIYPIVHSTTDEIRFMTDRGLISVGYRNGVLRKRIDHAGHIPLLTNVQKHDFELKDRTIHITVTFTDGLKKEGAFVIGLFED